MVAFARSVGAALFGVDARLVDIQVSVPGGGEHGVFRLVGMADGALREGKERIRGAIVHTGYAWPEGTLTVNLAPASARKEGPSLDLPIALAILQACGSVGRAEVLGRTLCIGELTLDGRVRPVRGVLASVEAARATGLAEALVPTRNAAEAAAVPGVVVRAVDTLAEAVGHLRGTARLAPVEASAWTPDPYDPSAVDQVRGQAVAVRAAVVAAAGGHNLLLIGAPGAGKTLLARAVASLLPPLTYDDALEVSRVHSAAGLLDGGLATTRPFRAPHHTTSAAGLLGGGSLPRPGEVALAHRGVLFLDELAEFPRPTLEGLRQPLEDGEIVIGRAAGRARFPTEGVLIGAMNPCPCGWLGSGVRPCRCPSGLATRYRGRVSGPLLDRFDLRIGVKPVDAAELVTAAPEAEGLARRAEVLRAREAQLDRQRRMGLPRAWNARIPPSALGPATAFTAEATDRLLSSARRMLLSGRGVHRAMRVARTLADLDGSDPVHPRHVDVALQYRGEDA